MSYLVTGCAGFIGSHLVATLLREGHSVTGLDNFATGFRANLDAIRKEVDEQAWSRFTFIEGDLRSPQTCHDACRGVDVILHQGALGSVPRSIDDPFTTHEVNTTGTLNLFLAARDAGVRRLVYASSSSVYGDEPNLPKTEDRIGNPLSPYALSKLNNELHAEQFSRHYGLSLVGLRYFNVFGPRQSPDGPYAAVIPRWIDACTRAEPIVIFGDGQTSRDFCYVDNVVQANLRAASAQLAGGHPRAFNIAVGDRTTLSELATLIRGEMAVSLAKRERDLPPVEHQSERPGDVRHSLADISQAQKWLGYSPTVTVETGLRRAVEWFVKERGE